MRFLPINLFAGLCLLSGSVAHAGTYEIGAAKGMMIAGILHEKCTGKPPIPNETEKQYKLLLSQGASDADIKQGFMQGMIYAEGNYPGNTKPSKKECQESIAMHQQAMKYIK